MANRARGWVATTALCVGLFGGGSAALAQGDYPGRTPPTLTEDAIEPAVLGRTATRAASDPIPITGSDVAGLTAIGVAAIVTGAALVRHGRRSSAPD